MSFHTMFWIAGACRVCQPATPGWSGPWSLVLNIFQSFNVLSQPRHTPFWADVKGDMKRIEMPWDGVVVSFCSGRAVIEFTVTRGPEAGTKVSEASVCLLGTVWHTLVPWSPWYSEVNKALVPSFAFHLYQVVIFCPILLHAICLSIQRTECKKLPAALPEPCHGVCELHVVQRYFFRIWDWRLIQKSTQIIIDCSLRTRSSWNSQPFCVRYSLDSELYNEAGPVVRYEIKRPYQE